MNLLTCPFGCKPAKFQHWNMLEHLCKRHYVELRGGKNMLHQRRPKGIKGHYAFYCICGQRFFYPNRRWRNNDAIRHAEECPVLGQRIAERLMEK